MSNDPTTSRRETWRDWLKDKPEPTTLYTRDEIAEMASGVDKISGNDIRYWEYQGVLPRSIRQWHNGAARAVYPEWYAHLARMVRSLQRHGLGLDEIGPRIRQRAERLLHMDLTVAPFTLPAVVQAALNDMARDLSDLEGADIASIELSITLTDGSGTMFSVPIDPQTDR